MTLRLQQRQQRVGVLQTDCVHPRYTEVERRVMQKEIDRLPLRRGQGLFQPSQPRLAEPPPVAPGDQCIEKDEEACLGFLGPLHEAL